MLESVGTGKASLLFARQLAGGAFATGGEIMQDGFSVRRDETSDGADGEAPPPFVPSIDMQQVFRQLIIDEIRSGRPAEAGSLTPAQRRRIVRYAAGLGLSAVQAGRLITSCHNEAGELAGPVSKMASPGSANRSTKEPTYTLHLVEPAPPRIPTVWKIALVVTCALVADWLILTLLL